MLHLAFLGTQELLIIGGIVVVLFGARKLPELARSMGSSVTQFKKGLKDEPAQLKDSGESTASEASTAGGESKD